MTDSNDETKPGKDATEPTDANNEATAADEAEAENKAEDTPESKRGSVRYQDAETTTPREPTLAEKRAMRKALEEEEEREKTDLVEVERKALRRRRVMIGAGVTVGVVATVAVWYAAASPQGEVTANCVDNSDALSSNENICTEEYVTSHGGYSSGGFFFLPIGGGGYQQYHYNYGGSVQNGRVTGGSTAAPSGRTTVKSTSGATVQRGGFGVSGGGKSGGS
jgi:hypothetical protein